MNEDSPVTTYQFDVDGILVSFHAPLDSPFSTLAKMRGDFQRHLAAHEELRQEYLEKSQQGFMVEVRYPVIPIVIQQSKEDQDRDIQLLCELVAAAQSNDVYVFDEHISYQMRDGEILNICIALKKGILFQLIETSGNEQRLYLPDEMFRETYELWSRLRNESEE